VGCGIPSIVMAAKRVNSSWNGCRNKLGKTLNLCVILPDDILNILTCKSLENYEVKVKMTYKKQRRSCLAQPLSF
jgi:hypothetical protein